MKQRILSLQVVGMIRTIMELLSCHLYLWTDDKEDVRWIKRHLNRNLDESISALDQQTERRLYMSSKIKIILFAVVGVIIIAVTLFMSNGKIDKNSNNGGAGGSNPNIENMENSADTSVGDADINSPLADNGTSPAETSGSGENNSNSSSSNSTDRNAINSDRQDGTEDNSDLPMVNIDQNVTGNDTHVDDNTPADTESDTEQNTEKNSDTEENNTTEQSSAENTSDGSIELPFVPVQ